MSGVVRSFRIGIRCDASTEIGFGHLTRMLTLAGQLSAQWSRAGGVELDLFFLLKDSSEQAVTIVLQQGFRYERLPADERKWFARQRTSPVGGASGLDVLIVDDYRYTAEGLRELRSFVGKLVLIDDVQPERVTDAVDGLINVNLGYETLTYPSVEGQMRWFGPEFALLRPQFAEAIQSAESSAESLQVNGERRTNCERVLVCIGGSDADNWTGRVLQAFCELNPSEVRELTVILGPGNVHRAALADLAESAVGSDHGHYLRDTSIQLSFLENVTEIARLMHHHDMAIVSASTMALESLCLGVPCAYLITVENQILLGEALVRHQLAWKLTDYRERDEMAPRLQDVLRRGEERQARALAGMAVVRVDGAQLLAMELLKTFK